jgi:cyclic pyranopterin phosphate synthase
MSVGGHGHPELPDPPDEAGGAAGALIDRLGRPMSDLRISVTDRCNFRCQYCMPKEIFGPDYAFLPRQQILTFEETARIARIAADLGVRKIRLTGGEPLLRSELHKHRVTVSLDSLDDEIFREMNDMNFPVQLVLEGIEAAQDAGLSPIKVNAVVRRGVNDHTLLDLARHFHGTPHTLRFIEFMDVGTTNSWRLDEVVPSAELVRMIDEEMPIEPVDAGYRGEVARRYRYRDGGGEVGFITSVTQPFCADCTRLRVSAEGQLYTCLFAVEGSDLRAALRTGASDEELTEQIATLWRRRDDRYSELRSEATDELPRIEMSYIGG